MWKTKLPLKIKVFMVYLCKKVVLTKDNLLKRNWKGNVSCCFCPMRKDDEHLFFRCPLVMFVQRVVSISLGIPVPTSNDHVFGTCI